jgi:transcriptional regulator with XRE-family HTH domain
MSNLEKLNKILSDQKSPWEQEAAWRNENETWLTTSFDIAVRILDTLRAKKITQKELAAKMHVSPQFINKVVKGQENLSLETIGKLSSALGVKLIDVPGNEMMSENVYDFEQAYEVSEQYRKEFFAKASAHGCVDLQQIQQYKKEQELEYKIPA